MTVRDKIDSLMQEASSLPAGQVKVELLTEAASLADTHNLPDRSFAARQQSLRPCYDAGRPELLLVNYAWCLAYADRHPEPHLRNILWAYRWVASTMPDFPQITREQIEAAADDMATRYGRAGYSLRPVHVMRRFIYEKMGDGRAAQAAGRQINRHHRDEMSDSAELELAFKASYQVLMGQWRRALATVEPMLSDQIVNRDRVYQKRVHSEFLVPLARAGQIERAKALQRAAYPLIVQYLTSVRWQIEFLAVVGNLAAAIRLVERHLPQAASNASLDDRFGVYRASRLLVDRLRTTGHARTQLALPANLLAAETAERWSLDALAARLDVELASLAARFDRRNGNTYYAKQIVALKNLNRLADRLARGVSP
jgi:hypothetical protein